MDLELAEEKIALAILTAANTSGDILRLLDALSAIAAEYHATSPAQTSAEFSTLSALPPMVYPPRQAWFAHKKSILFAQTIGQVSAEAVIPYPPGIPVLYPGEKITEEIWKMILHLKKQGCHFHGPTDLSLETIQIISPDQD